jgi:hypothetical protein
MAKNNKAGLFVGLAAAGVAVYLLTKSKSTAPATTTAAGTTTLPYAPAVATATSAVNAGSSLINTLSSAVKSIFGGGSSTPTFTPVGLQPTTTTSAPSPASSINYIDPSSAPTLSITGPAADNSVADNSGNGVDLSNIFL